MLCIRSVERVVDPRGYCEKQWMVVMHDNTMPVVNNSWKQGEVFYKTGRYQFGENGVPDHVHIEVGYGDPPANYSELKYKAHSNINSLMFVDIIPSDKDLSYCRGASDMCSYPGSSKCPSYRWDMEWTLLNGRKFWTPWRGGSFQPGGGSGGGESQVSDNAMQIAVTQRDQLAANVQQQQAAAQVKAAEKDAAHRVMVQEQAAQRAAEEHLRSFDPLTDEEAARTVERFEKLNDYTTEVFGL